MRKLLTSVLLLVLVSGCTRERTSESPPIHLVPNMDIQERYEAQGSSQFFADGSAMRMPVEGTVARGHLYEDVVFFTGRDAGGKLVRRSPLVTSMATLKRGQERYNIYCSPCHSRTGDGQGMVTRRGFQPTPTSIHDERLIAVEDGHLFEVISNGVRNMPAYRSQVPAADRWAMVAYMRALQRSQNATKDDIPEDIRGNIQ